MMTLNEKTLGQATTARDSLLDLQHKTEVARVDYHHLIRRLHADGGSLREIAEALGLSHQRVHQIVEPVDGSTGRGPRGHHHGPGPAHGFGPGPMHRVARRLRSFVGFERFTAEAREVVAAAVARAEELGHRRVGTEHLLLALTQTPAESPSRRAFDAAGVTADAVLAAVTEKLGAGPAGTGRRPFTSAARRVLAGALGEATDRGDRDLRAEHILLALIADDGDAAAILRALGADPQALHAALNEAGAG